MAVVDGSGVLCDPQGLDRKELTRLAEARKMIVNFDTSKLSSNGFRVLIEENGVKLPGLFSHVDTIFCDDTDIEQANDRWYDH